jgi:hypothetical protein
MKVCHQLSVSDVHEHIERDWDRVQALMPLDLETTAREEKALQRRRKVQRGSDLLRLVLGYAVCDWSLRLTGAWATLIGLGNLSDVAVLKRLRGCRPWLGRILGAWLTRRRAQLTRRSVRLRLIDATVVTRPGSQGTDWRAHLSLDLGQLSLDGIEITDARGGETYARHATQPGDILIGDRAHAHASSLGPVLAGGAHTVTRISWQNLRLYVGGQRLDVIAWLRSLGSGLAERKVWLETPQGGFALRLVACRLPQQTADATRRRLIRNARKKGRTVDQRTLFAAGFVIVITNLPEDAWEAALVIELYRLRWQIELACKRLKSVLHLDHLRAQDPVLAQVYLLGKLLGALILDELMGTVAAHHAAWFWSVDRPLSPWRLQALLLAGLHTAVRGAITLQRILTGLPQLERYLCDSPRKRRQQAALARRLLRALQPNTIVALPMAA